MKPLAEAVFRLGGEPQVDREDGATPGDDIALEVRRFAEEIGRPGGYYEALFHSIPVGILVVDSAHRVRAVNPLSEAALSLRAGPHLNRPLGEVLGCPQAGGPCGGGVFPNCQYCGIRTAILETFKGVPAKRKIALLRSQADGMAVGVDLLVSTSLTRIRGEELCIVLLEDVTEDPGQGALARHEDSFAGIVGRDHRMQALFHTIRDLSDRMVPVLIQGESGTGKELVASAIHMHGPRASQPFVAVNCGAVPETLVESEFFGHVKGAFTGAIRDKKGRFELATGGSLFLDEVGELSPQAQVKLLRILQVGTFEPLGSERTVKVDVRIISATNKNLVREVKEGRFRSDLFYRLCVVPLFLPPLRERSGDIALLAEHVLASLSASAHQAVPKLAPETLRLLESYPWPGNIRQLENALHFALIQSKGCTLLPEHFSLPLEPGEGRPTQELISKTTLTEERVVQALRTAKGNKFRAARVLGVSRSSLYRFLDKHLRIRRDGMRQVLTLR